MKRQLLAILICLVSTAVPAAEQPDSTAMSALLNEVVVTGSNASIAADKIPYTVSVIGSTELDNAGSEALLDVLSVRVPSLFVTQRGILGYGVSSSGGSGHIKMRGVGGDRASATLMMVDGQPQFAGIYSHHVADFYQKDNVERVEVLRGPGSVLYGSNAMAGVINVITRNAQHDGTTMTLTSQYGSYNTWQSSLDVTARYGKVSALASVSYDRTDGHMRNFDFSQWSGYAKAMYSIDRHFTATADLTLTNFVGDDPLYPKLSDPESQDIYHQNVTRGETSLSVSDRYDTTNGVLRAYYNWGNHYIDDPRHFHSNDDRLGILAYQNFTPWHGASATAGFDFARYTGEIPVSGGTHHHEGSLSTLSRKSISEYSPYLTLAQSLLHDQIVLNAGIRMANSDRFGTHWIPQGGVTIAPLNLLTIKASVAKGYRNPSFRELYLYRMANPDLEPEQMWDYEVSLGRQFGRLFSAEITFYYCRGTNMIEVVNMHNENTGRFINKGIEIAAASTPIKSLTLNASYSYLHTSLDKLTGAPRHQYFLGVDWTAFAPLTISAQLRGVVDLYVSDDLHNQNYALVDMKATYRLTRWLDLFVRLENITDARYTINRGYPMPGFTAMGGFRLKIYK